MAGTVGNFITTTFLTLICSAILVVTYRQAIRPILLKHNIIPLQNLPQTLSNTFGSRGHVRLPSQEYDDADGESRGPVPGQRRGMGGISRDLEEGFKDDSDDEESRDERIAGPQPGTPAERQSRLPQA